MIKIIIWQQSEESSFPASIPHHAEYVEFTEVFPKLSETIAVPFNTLHDLMVNASARYADRPALGVKKDGVYNYHTYADVGRQVTAFRGSLARMGVGKGDKVAIISRNRFEWVLTAYAGYGLGAVNVPMYEQQKESDWRYILEDSGAKVLIASTQEIYDKVKGYAGTHGQVETVLCCDLPDDHSSSFAHHLQVGEEMLTAFENDCGDTSSGSSSDGANQQYFFETAVAPDDLATLIYTSGTTGQPKGVMLSHRNICSNVKNTVDHTPEEKPTQGIVNWDDRSVAFLPWAHSYGQTCELHTGMAVGASTAIAAGAPGDAVELLANIQETKPTILFSVPTLFKKVFDGVNKKIDDETSPVTKFLMQRALVVGEKVRLAKEAGSNVGPFVALQHRVLDKIVLSKMRATFGGNLRMAFAAGAPTPVAVLQFMENLGVQMTEGYGLTETSPVVSVTYPDPRERVVGTVGKPLPNVSVKVVMDGVEVPPGEEGELWVSGENVMQGYWGKPEATAEVIVDAKDGFEGKRWFRTGDLVTVLKGGHIKVTGRIKEQYKLENGKYVAPAPIEEAMTLNKYVAQVVLYGDGMPNNVAVVVPDFPVVAEHMGIEDYYNAHEMCRDPAVHALLAEQLPKEMTARDVKKYEQPKKFLLLPEPFSAANEMLTPKLSIRKPNVIKFYKKDILDLYNLPDETECASYEGRSFEK